LLNAFPELNQLSHPLSTTASHNRDRLLYACSPKPVSTNAPNNIYRVAEKCTKITSLGELLAKRRPKTFKFGAIFAATFSIFLLKITQTCGLGQMLLVFFFSCTLT